MLQYSCLKNLMDREPGGLQSCKKSDMTKHAHWLLLVKQSCGLVLIISPISVLSTAGREKYPFYSALWHQSESPWEPAALQWPFQSLCSPGEAGSRAASCEWKGERLGKVLGNWAQMIKHKAQPPKGWCLQAEDQIGVWKQWGEEWRNKVQEKLKSEWIRRKKINSEVQFSSVAQSCPTLRPHGLQHTRLPCSSPTPGAYSSSCPLSELVGEK